MGKASPAITAFNAGEFAPQMQGRVDVEKYPIAAYIQQNFIPLKQGCSTFRNGTAFVQTVKNSANRTWLRRFEFSQTQAYMLEFGDKYVRFYANHGPLLATGVSAYSGATTYHLGDLALSGGIIYYAIATTLANAPPNASFWYPMSQYNGSTSTAINEIPSPYAASDLTNASGSFALDIKQQGDVLYIAGGSANYAPYTLTRFANAPPNWQFSTYFPQDGPFADAVPLSASPGINIAVGVSGQYGPAVTVTSYGGSLFASTDVGRLIRIGSQFFNQMPWATATGWAAGQICVNNGNNYLALTSATSGGSPPIHTSGSALDGPTGVRWLYTDSGYGIGQITAFTSATQVTVNVLKRFPANVVTQISTITAASNANPCVLTAVNTFTAGQAIFVTGVLGMTQINGFAYAQQTQSGTTVTLAGVDSTTYTPYVSGGQAIGNATLEWQLGAWSNTTEWPRCVAFFKDRAFFAGKLKIWGSVPGLYTSMTPDFFSQQTTDSAINLIVAGLDASNITWLSDNLILLIGTEGGEYGLDAANVSSPLGPTNVEILPQSQWRSRGVRPSKIGTSLLYLQRAGRRVMAADYNFYLNRYDSTDQNKFSYHISIGAITTMAYQQEPWSLLWATRTDGTLLSYTFNREDNVTAWVRHNLGNAGLAESIDVIPAPDGTRDELWLIVNRTVNGAVLRTVEYMVKHYEGPQAGYIGDAQSSAWYVDCGIQAFPAPTFPITNVISVFSALHGGNTQYFCLNSFSVGQTVFVSGVVSTGTFNANVQGVLITACTATSFTIAQNLGSGSFNYLSGGAVSVGAAITSTITGLPSVMWNQTVNILADGGVLPQQVVSATGTLALSKIYSIVTIGFPYQGNLVPMRMEGGADVGSAQGKVKNGQTVVIRCVDSQGLIIGQLSNQNAQGFYQDPLGQLTLSMDKSEEVFDNSTNTALDSPPPFMSGDVAVNFPLNQLTEQDRSDFFVLVQQNQPLPATVAGLFPQYKVEEFQ